MEALECDYAAGMFSCVSGPRPTRSLDMVTYLTETELVEIHEAGHAVADFALGRGCEGISLEERRLIKDGGMTVAYTGIVHPKKAKRGAHRNFERGVLDETIIAFGVTVAAGPAAERKYRLREGLPLDMVGYTAGDHQLIETVAKTLARVGGHDRAAYQEEVWRRAQAMMEDATIWGAVIELAGCLKGLWEWIEPPDGGEGIFSETMPGAEAREIMRRAGVTPGMLSAE